MNRLRVMIVRAVVLSLGLLAGLPAVPARAQEGAALTLRAGDAIRVHVWREADLSGDFFIDETGRVTLPLLGPVAVAGRTVADVRTELVAGYARELRNPSVTIIPLRRVSVLGEVNRPGAFSVDPTVALSDLMAMAGGATENGDLRRIKLVRGGQVIAQQLAPGVVLSTVDVRSGDQIFVGQRSWLGRNSGYLISSLVGAALSVAASLLIVK